MNPLEELVIAMATIGAIAAMSVAGLALGYALWSWWDRRHDGG
jgi:hypothetical protein